MTFTYRLQQGLRLNPYKIRNYIICKRRKRKKVLLIL